MSEPLPIPETPDGRTDCTEFALRAYEYIDQEMTVEDCDRVRRHLDECAECFGEYERDVVLKALIRRSCACEEAPVALRLQIMTRITLAYGSTSDERGRGRR
ncbi:mycothiol system anti-sigma-R factor [Agilicoccus flavus]|uniref:mycothiol system anti-sigma-R factor n=1 Tax=Agilicoccus flavus TaxID=2775968 RepID=UPI001CF6C5B6|nr:mycothiol system anti-sigma-R factor [Agilicoccus flavus]